MLSGIAGTHPEFAIGDHMDWETISHQIIVDEETPNHERLLEWQERYPEYSKEIAECITLL